jgi:hypothetical protein
VQVPRRVYAEVSQEVAFRQNKTASGPSVSRSGATEGVPDRGGAFDAGSRPHVDINTSQIFGGADHRIHEGEESDMDRAECRTQDAEFPGPQILGMGYFVTTVGRDGEVIRAYIRNQELADQQLEQFELQISAAQNPINRPKSLKTAFGGSQSNLQLCWRLLAYCDGR